MPQDTLNEREFELINIIGAELASNQRDLSRHMDISLGMTNMLIRRLVEKGFIRIRQLNKKKAEYFLTPKGFAEKMRKSVKYTIKTINSIRLIKDQIKKVIKHFYQEGERVFLVYGEPNLTFLVEMVLQEIRLEGSRLLSLDEIPEDKVDGVILICKENIPDVDGNINICVDLVRELAKANNFVARDFVETGK